ncbi:MAG: hypothetical protein IKM75_09410 [Bacteroidales bacterium]|jgi:hypothetical protein|nr:hypothetical protein [Bacteroidales bacterium]
MKTQNNPITESTAVKSNAEKKGMSPLWQSVLVGGVPGILIGSAGTIGVEAIANSSSVEEQGEAIQEEATTMETVTEIQEAHSVTDEMSFSEAFASARAEVGPGGAFSWRGHVYGTYRGDDPEWQGMSDEDRAAHSKDILSQVHAAPYTPTENEPEIVPAPEDSSEIEDVNPVDEAVEDANDIDVHILGVGAVQAPDGSVAQVGVGTIDDHAAVFADTDGDDVVDTVLIDVNDNRYVEHDEIYDASGAGITMDDLRNSVETPMDVMEETPNVPETPDNTLFI